MNDNYLTMKEIGMMTGATSYQVGRWLKKIGLRPPEGKPSTHAFEGDYVSRRYTWDGSNYLVEAGFVKPIEIAEDPVSC